MLRNSRNSRNSDLAVLECNIKWLVMMRSNSQYIHNYVVAEYEYVPEIDAIVGTLTSLGLFSLGNLTEDQANALRYEEAGQLYAYRYSNATVVLGTRSATILGANIGIGSNAVGEYRCIARNHDAITTRELTISTSERINEF